MSVQRAAQLTIPDLVAERAASFGDRVALVGEQPQERLTFAQTADRMWQLAAALRRAGVRRGDCVASLGMNSASAFEALLATSAVGAVFASLNWRQTDDELAVALEVANPAFTLFDEEWAHLVDGPGHAYRELDGLRAGAAGDEPRDDSDEDDAALRLFTAAFDGRPRAADLSHRALLSITAQQIAAHSIDHEQVLLNSGPMFHVGGWIFALPVFAMGGTTVFPRKWEAEQAAEIVERERVTWAYLVPPMGSQLLDAAERDDRDLSSLRKGVAFEDRERWYARTSAHEETHVMPYGQTEVAGLATYQVSLAGGPPTHGLTLPLVRAAIVDVDGQEVADGEVGEIALRGPTVMLGYAGAADATAERFRDGWYRTSDLGRRAPDGSIQFVGPIAEIIKTGAENVYPAEVEVALRSHPAIKDVCVIGVPDDAWGSAVKAVLVTADGATIDLEQVQAHCRARIASYKKPRHLAVVDELPRSGPFVDRERVRELHGEPSPAL
jgi:acyl-CoA synthetase (AMP-forming)/AMP-acid ligase II